MKKLFSLLLPVLALHMAFPGTANAQVNNFSIADYTIDYHLSRDTENRSVLHTKETITADFRIPNQNRGIERAIPENYDNHSTGLTIESVQDETGKDRQYSTYSSNDNLVIRIGDPNQYVIGKQTYVITYTQRDVTKYFADTNSQEFYWDTNGTEWRVPIEQLSVTLRVDEALVDHLTGDTACYVGAQNSTQACELIESSNSFSSTATNLKQNENMTLAIGFKPNTFAAYQAPPTPLWMKIFTGWLALQVLLLIVSFGLLVWLVMRYNKWKDRKQEIGTIIPEYLPPKEVSVTTSAALLGSTKGLSAQMIDFAVRHYLKIYQTREKSTFKAAEYKIEISKDILTLLAEEQELLSDMFGHPPKVGETLELKSLQKNTDFRSRLLDNPKKLRDLMRSSYGLRHQVAEKSGWFKSFGRNLLITSILLLSPPLFIVSIIAFVCGYMLWPLTDKGLDLVRYLKGLKLYIAVAEEARLQLLQSPDGAVKAGVSGQPDSTQLIKLYEKVLPYAILYGQEKEWNKRLAAFYEQNNANPDWFVGQPGTVLSATALTSAMNTFSSQYATLSYSSSGGSGGGGFSGGGGGGGGGGGW